MEPTPAKVLVVDDNEANRDLARETLEDEGYQVVLATGGEEGIRAFEQEHPDCILLDVRMPGTDGFAVCARVRSLPGGADVPVVFLTAQRDLDTFEQALRAGGDDFVTKPVRPAELVLRVQAALKLRRTGFELREYSELVRRQRDDLMRLTLQKERLTAFVVHDLKNPVNSMDLLAQLLLRNQALPADARERVQQLRGELRGLLRLVLNLLDISKSEEGRLEPARREIPLRAFLSEIGEAFAAGARSNEVDLRCDVELETLEADPDLLRRVLENLLDNALRHAPAGSAISLSARQEDGSAVLRIADQGKGIPPELREKIFERFAQVEQPQGSTASITRTGRGLGLTFCKLAVEVHGGSIAVEEGNPGAIFCIRIPSAH